MDIEESNELAITHLRLRVRAWQLALDPQTKAWIAATKQALADGHLAAEVMDHAEAVRRLEVARRDLSA